MLLPGVPVIRQEKSMSCWHAAARMLYGYRHQACGDPLHSIFKADTGIAADQFIDLAKSIGLSTIPQMQMTYDRAFIENLLRLYGPIWAAGMWNGVPHVIVVTGVLDDGTLYLNDPADGMQHVRDMLWFNDRIAREVPIPMMFLP